MKNRTFAALAFATAVAIIAASRLIPNDYFFSAAYTVLQFIILATAWNILGGYTGYVNFGSAAFFATGAYSSVFLYKALHAPLVVMIVTGTLAPAGPEPGLIEVIDGAGGVPATISIAHMRILNATAVN